MHAAEFGWVTAGAGLIAFDVWLNRTDRQLLTDVARAHPHVTTFVISLLALHFADVLGRFDPFRAAGHAIAKKG